MTIQKDQAEERKETLQAPPRRSQPSAPWASSMNPGPSTNSWDSSTAEKSRLTAKTANITADHPRRAGTRPEIRAEQPPGLRARRIPGPVHLQLAQRVLPEDRVHDRRGYRPTDPLAQIFHQLSNGCRNPLPMDSRRPFLIQPAPKCAFTTDAECQIPHTRTKLAVKATRWWITRWGSRSSTAVSLAGICVPFWNRGCRHRPNIRLRRSGR